MIWLILAAAAAHPNAPIARGPNDSVAAVARAARLCGIKDLRIEPLGTNRATLLIGGHATYRSVDCTLGWMKQYYDRLHLEPLFVGNLAS